MSDPGAIHSPSKDEKTRPPQPNPAPADKAGTGTPLLKPRAPSEGLPGGQKG